MKNPQGCFGVGFMRKILREKKIGFSKSKFNRGWWSDYFRALKNSFDDYFQIAAAAAAACQDFIGP